MLRGQRKKLTKYQTKKAFNNMHPLRSAATALSKFV